MVYSALLVHRIAWITEGRRLSDLPTSKSREAGHLQFLALLSLEEEIIDKQPFHHQISSLRPTVVAPPSDWLARRITIIPSSIYIYTCRRLTRYGCNGASLVGNTRAPILSIIPRRAGTSPGLVSWTA